MIFCVLCYYYSQSSVLIQANETKTEFYSGRTALKYRTLLQEHCLRTRNIEMTPGSFTINLDFAKEEP